MKSIFDGWTKKIEHRLQDDNGGYCAIGWLRSQPFKVEREATDRIGNWIIKNMDPPEEWKHLHGYIMDPASIPSHAIVWANNEMKLDIEGFKMVDLLTRGYVPEEAVPECAVA